MTSSTHVDRERQLIIHRLSGPVSLTAATKTYGAALDAEGFRKGMSVIWDLRRADLTPAGSFETISALAEHVREGVARRGRDYRTALVVSRDVDFGLSRMLIALFSDIPLNIRVFRSMDRAGEWVTAPGGTDLPD